MNPFVPIILIGGLILITLFLIVIDKLLGGGKEKMLLVNEDTIIPVKNEDTLLNTLSNQKIYIPSACGGKATCGFCKFRLIEGGGEVKPTELPFLSKEERDLGIRLSCQVKVKDDMKIEIPKELLHAKSYQTKVVEIIEQTYDIKLVRFKLIDPDKMEFKPGQYAQIKVPGIDVIRAYSIASNPKDTSEIELIVRQVPNGKATTFVHKALQVGDKITLTGPYGDFYLRDSGREMICIAGGSGKAPIRSILYYLKDRGMTRKVTYFFGAKSKRDLYMTEEFEQLMTEFPNFTYVPALSEPLEEDNWKGEVGLITDVVDRHTDDLSEAEAYLCGSPGMINACNKVLSKHKIKEHNVFFDKF